MDSRCARLLPTPYENKLSMAKGKRTNHICVAYNTNMVERAIPANRKATPYGVAFLLAAHHSPYSNEGDIRL